MPSIQHADPKPSSNVLELELVLLSAKVPTTMKGKHLPIQKYIYLNKKLRILYTIHYKNVLYCHANLEMLNI